jgi:hypothetical protein
MPEFEQPSSVRRAALPSREGLPHAFRMRADTHYVEALEHDSFAPAIRYLDAAVIESTGDDELPTSDFIESVRRHGVLQPLLVRGRAGRYRVIAGRKRLAAALASGMRRVPCVVHRVDDDEASRLAAATNLRSDALPSTARTPPAEAVLTELSSSLSALVSSVNLWTTSATPRQVEVSDLIKAEAARALRLLWAARVLRPDLPHTIAEAHLLHRARLSIEPERHLRAIELAVIVQSARDARIHGDAALLAEAIAALAGAAWTVFEMAPGSRLLLRALVRRDHYVTIEACREAFTVDHAALTGVFERPWSVPGGPAALAMLQAARKVAQTHGGHASATTGPSGTSVALMLPLLR